MFEVAEPNQGMKRFNIREGNPSNSEQDGSFFYRKKIELSKNLISLFTLNPDFSQRNRNKKLNLQKKISGYAFEFGIDEAES